MVELAEREAPFERSDVPSLEEQNLLEEMGRRKPRGNPLTKVAALLLAVLMLNGTLVFAAAQHMNWKEAVARAPELAVIPGLTGTNSQITGILDPETLTASYYWTFVVHNATNVQQEAQLKLLLPPRATVSRATLWVNGVAEEAAFNSTARVEQAYNWITRMHRDPLLVTQTAPRTVSIKAAPVEPNGDMRFRLGITAAGVLKNGKVLYVLPRVTAANMDVSCKQYVHLVSENGIQSNSANLQTVVDADTQILCKGSINPADLQGLVISSDRLSEAREFATRATHASQGSVILAKLVPINTTTSQMMLRRVPALPSGIPAFGLEDQAFRLSTLWAFGEIENTAMQGRVDIDSALATTYRVVTCVSGATVLERQSDYQHQGLTRDPYMVTAYQSNDFVLPTANADFQYPISNMPAFLARESDPRDGLLGGVGLIGAMPLGALLSFGFARGALQSTLSQSFSSVVNQLNALNAYSAAGGSYGSASSLPNYSVASQSPSANSWTSTSTANGSTNPGQAYVNMETQNQILHDSLVAAGTISGFIGCGLSKSLLAKAEGGKSLVAELFNTPTQAIASIAEINAILLLVMLNFYGCLSMAGRACRLGQARESQCNDLALGSILWFVAALLTPDISQILSFMKLTGHWFQENEAARTAKAAA